MQPEILMKSERLKKAFNYPKDGQIGRLLAIVEQSKYNTYK
jgi:hypothetical protein